MSKYQVSSVAIESYPLDAAVSASLAQVHRDDTDTIEEEWIDYLQQVQTPSLEDHFRQYLIMQRTLTDRMTSVDTTV